MDDDSFSDEEHNEYRIINEEYKRWKKNTPFLYDLVLTKALDWPSLTVEWFPDEAKDVVDLYSVQGVLLGTHTATEEGRDPEQNFLMIAQVHLPVDDTPFDSLPTQNFNTSPAKVEIKQRINHPGEVNRARLVPQIPWVVATKTVSGDVLIFNLKQHPEKPIDNSYKPSLTLKGHQPWAGNSYGLSWNSNVEGHLLSASEDQTICLWDIQGGIPSAQKLQPLNTFRGHTDVVEDVAWHPMHETFFASVGDDKLLVLWDSRDPPNKPVIQSEAHLDAVNCVSFNPFDEVYCLTGSSDKTVALWDLRNLKQKLHSFESHWGEVGQVQWSPHSVTAFASASSDRRINVWDIKKIGEAQTAEEKEDGPPELLFIHGGHTGKITDFGWSPHAPWVIASASQDNILQIWKMAEPIYEYASFEKDDQQLPEQQEDS